ncbi:acetate--CoA ligase [Candidatus Bathyarchaeota archaeon]|jgi:acetyl-CoA synthetase|nr:acetate--CoA ligase [Candidatus Bathyarchaeota archaeon]
MSIVWNPTRQYVDNSNMKRFMQKHGIETLDELIKRSIDDVEWFWDAASEDLNIEWFRPYEKILDTSKGIEWARWFIGGKLNIAHNCIDRHAKARRDKTAIIWQGEDGQVRKLSYGTLGEEVNRFANGLKSLGVRKGDAIGLYMPMSPQVPVSMFGAFKLGAICVPIFSGFGASAVASRLNDVKARILVTADGTLRKGRSLQVKKEADTAADLVKSIEHVVVCKRLGVEVPWSSARDIWWDDLVRSQSKECSTAEMDSEDVSLVLYSSGTTGKPKGCVHTHAGPLLECTKDVAYHFDTKDNDVFFWVTDIGWMMGPWMLIGNLNLGSTVVLFEGAFDYPRPDRLWKIVGDFGVTVFGISPTLVRLLMRYGDQHLAGHNLSSLRILGSTGEPWDPESWTWFFEKVGGSRCPIINITGGTELIAPHLTPSPLTPLKPCTVGGPGLGMDVDVFNEEGRPVREEVGYLVMKKPCPSMTKGFWNDPQRYIETYWSRWPKVWYHADWALVDKDGFWFVLGRADDTIKVSGRRVGPAEVESALMEHPSVSEAAAVGVPDEVKGEEVTCFVVLKPSIEPTENLRETLKDQVAAVMGKTFRPRDIRFVRQLPKTRSGKVVRRLIRSRLLGKTELGDLSTLDNPEALDEIAKAL